QQLPLLRDLRGRKPGGPDQPVPDRRQIRPLFRSPPGLLRAVETGSVAPIPGEGVRERPGSPRPELRTSGEDQRPSPFRSLLDQDGISAGQIRSGPRPRGKSVCVDSAGGGSPGMTGKFPKGIPPSPGAPPKAKGSRAFGASPI